MSCSRQDAVGHFGARTRKVICVRSPSPHSPLLSYAAANGIETPEMESGEENKGLKEEGRGVSFYLLVLLSFNSLYQSPLHRARVLSFPGYTLVDRPSLK